MVKRYQDIDVIVIGSGPGGATVAKELSLRKKKVLILERGDNMKARLFLMDALDLARDIHSTPLMLDAITGLACIEIHNSPTRAAALLKLVASHAATTQETRERACQMLLTLEPRLPIEQIEVLDPTADQSLDAVADLLLSNYLHGV